ncbi:MAG: hypothetical protein Kow0029_30430 [Candidatus Rifleibacteriota bacterium]
MQKFCCFMCLLCVFALVSGSVVAEPFQRYIVEFGKSDISGATRADIIKNSQKLLDKNIQKLKKIFKSMNDGDLNKLWFINAVALTASGNDIAKIKSMPEVKNVVKSEYRIWLDKDIAKTPVNHRPEDITWSVQKMRAPEVWNEFKIDGAGIVVGHLDTGVFAEHPALEGKILAFKDFTPEAKDHPFDGQGHGSHTAGTIVGGQGVGVAPGARLVVARVFDSKGGTTTEILLSAMQWVMDPDGDADTNDGPRLVSNSWGSNDSTDTVFWDAVQAWIDAGILPVFAAGNNGWMGGKVGTPAAFPHSWAVAATTKTDGLAYFSSQGPVSWNGETLIKPDISAPGNGVVSCSHTGGMVSNSGTSMACPGVAGVCALMFQADPALTYEQIRLIAEETSKDLGEEGKDNKFGAGLIDAYAAVKKILENAELANSYLAYEAALNTEYALIGSQAVSPLAAPLARSIIERTARLDEGQYRALCLKVAQECGESAAKLLKEANSLRVARGLNH